MAYPLGTGVLQADLTGDLVTPTYAPIGCVRSHQLPRQSRTTFFIEPCLSESWDRGETRVGDDQAAEATFTLIFDADGTTASAVDKQLTDAFKAGTKCAWRWVGDDMTENYDFQGVIAEWGPDQISDRQTVSTGTLRIAVDNGTIARSVKA